MRFSTMMKHPSAYLPVAMSVAALALVAGHVALFGVVRQADEGTAARVFQLLMVAQVPIIAFCAIQWVPRSPRLAVLILALQVGAALGALAPVFLLDF